MEVGQRGRPFPYRFQSKIKLIPPIILKRAAENQLNLLCPVIVGSQQNFDRGAYLLQARFGRQRTIRAIKPVQGCCHFEQFRPNWQKLLIKNVRRVSNFRHRITRKIARLFPAVTLTLVSLRWDEFATCTE